MINTILCLLLFCVHVVLVFASSLQSDWINHGGDLFNRRYAYNEHKINPETVSNLSLKWKFNAGKDITATPTIYNGTIYFPCWNGNIYAIKQIDGSLVWKQNLEELTGLNATGIIKAVNWSVARATPTVAEDLLIVGIYGPAVVIGLERRTGELIWLTHLDNHPAGVITMSGTYYNGKQDLVEQLEVEYLVHQQMKKEFIQTLQIQMPKISSCYQQI
ncbi:polyvinylalcohol dehydrogenase [Medicago truncatula]|uniref:polyvinylalcohol dehydrogenase n=1 Tax=Medicago truncatula TaxID=3880 RepID=UPI0019679D71|nr:polyvinylalcohol dehydrogenase [Medicago truncatula]